MRMDRRGSSIELVRAFMGPTVGRTDGQTDSGVERDTLGEISRGTREELAGAHKGTAYRMSRARFFRLACGSRQRLRAHRV